MSSDELASLAQRKVVVNLTESLVPLIMPVQQACYPEHLHEEPESFVDKVAASPTTSFVCLQANLANAQDGDFPLTSSEDAQWAAAASPSPATAPGLEVIVSADPEKVAAAIISGGDSSSSTPHSPTTPAKAVGYLITIPAERFQAPALDSTDCPKPDAGEVDTLYLHDMAVLPEARGLGVAQTLLSLAEQKKEELQLERMALIAVEGASSYWERQGFEAVRKEELPPEMQAKLKAYGDGAAYMEKVDEPTDSPCVA